LTDFARRLALLHLAPTLGDLEANRRLLEKATRAAANIGAQWALSGELVCSGYEFEPVIGTDWINQQPDKWMRSYAELAGELGICAFVHHPERNAATGCLFSTMFAIERGEIVGRHRKITPTPGSESWAQGGAPPVPIRMDGMSIGMLICADAYLPAPTKLLADAGAQIILSSAAWHPGEWGPSGEWEARSAETGVPIVVCNRTGTDRYASFDLSETVVAYGGERLISLRASRSTVFAIDLHLTRHDLVTRVTAAIEVF